MLYLAGGAAHTILGGAALRNIEERPVGLADTFAGETCLASTVIHLVACQMKNYYSQHSHRIEYWYTSAGALLPRSSRHE
jgi:hypothetical protein